MKFRRCAFVMALAFADYEKACAQTADTATDAALPALTISAERALEVPGNTADSAQLLSRQPGYATQAGGGVSAQPVLNGFAADRLKIRLDGMEVTAACGNQMNPPMSYMPPSQVGMTRVIAGITPVSVGGDSIGGSIELSSPAPQFADTPDQLLSSGGFSVMTRSVNDEISLAVHAAVASDQLALAYVGSQSRAQSYHDGNGDLVLDSLYKSSNQALTIATRGNDRQLTLKLSEQEIPYQGFPNEYMDMTGNRATSANLGYQQRFAWGQLDSRFYWQQTEHEMGFFSDERSGTMPMDTNGLDLGYTVRAAINLGQDDSSTLRLGNEFHAFRLNDYWPPVSGSMMMSPDTYVNINDGTRKRFALFAEWEQQLSAGWHSLLGMRDELVRMDTGDVQSYGSSMSSTDTAAADAFNASNHAKTYNNIDLTALLRYTADATRTVEFGYARKSRAPNLYELYTWGRSSMAMSMTGWFGDGNGYVGNLDLKPEVANTFSATFDWHRSNDAPNGSNSFFRLTPYFSYVQNYIDADVIGSFTPYGSSSASGNLLQFANHDALLYGLNLSWQLPLADTARLGQLAWSGNAALTRGRRVDGGNLYHMMPFNVLSALEQRIGTWINRAELNYVARKTLVDSDRLESVTAGYTLINLKSSYQINRHISVSAGVSNLLNRNYADPLGGVYLSGLANTDSGSLEALPGYGRSIDLGMTVTF